MQILHRSIDRKMIPRWRALRATPGVELQSSRSKKPFVRTHDPSSQSLIEDWNHEPSLAVAADLVSASFVNGKRSETDAAHRFLNQYLTDLTPSLRQLALAYESQQPDMLPPQHLQITKELKHQRIRELKQELSLYYRNPILLVDLARSYVSIGQVKKAEKSFRAALSMSPDSRFVLRSAARFFVFEGELEKTWRLLKDTSFSDLWLLAPLVAVSDALDKPIPSLRKLRAAIDGSSSSQSSELAAAVATIELQNGNVKLAKNLFKQGCVDPTDNTVAQARWAHEHSGVPFDRSLLNHALAHEARTGDAIEEHKWSDAVSFATKWLADEPFSGRAAATAAFLAAEMEMDYPLAERLATAGLAVNPHDPILLNNRAFSRACLGKIESAKNDVRLARSRSFDVTDNICLTATEGCIAYREGNPAAGQEMYRLAISMALEHGHGQWARRAIIHWFHELVRVDGGISREAAEVFHKKFGDSSTDSETRRIFDNYAGEYLPAALSGVSNPTDEFAVLVARVD